jgi:hypothetical protein
MQSRINVIQMSGKTRRSVACSYCRAKKIRCNGSIPCANCLDRAEECVVMPRRRSQVPHRVQQTAGTMLWTPSGETSSRVRLTPGATRPSTALHDSLSLNGEASIHVDQPSDPVIHEKTTVS